MSSVHRPVWFERSVLRRATLIVAAVVIGAMACGSAPSVAAPVDVSANPPTTQPGERYTYVVCHGATAGGYEWKDVAARLAADGHTMYRPTYTGLGERSHLANEDVDLETHITDIVNVIRFEGLRDVVLVGHSYGGMVMTGVADRLPDRVRAMVYVDAMLPENGESVATVRGLRRPTTGPTADAPTTAAAPATRPAPRSPMTSGQLGQPFRPGQTPPYNVTQPPKTFTQPIELRNQEATRRIPAVYLLTVDPGRQPEQDGFFGSSQRAAEHGYAVWHITADHVPSMTQPAELTRLLEAAPGAATTK